MHIYGIQKNGTEEFIYRAATEKQIQRTDLWTWGGGGEGEIYGKSNVETYITICKTESQWEFALWLGKLKQGLCINLEEWDGAGDGREVQKGGTICMPIVDSCRGLTENNKIL